MHAATPVLRRLCLGAALAALAGCGTTGPLDWDLRQPGAGLDTSEAALNPAQPRPAADSRGVISYPNYQVAVALRDDTVASLAGRVGVQAADLAQFNGMTPQTRLRQGEVLVLPSRVADSGGFGTGPAAGAIDITTLASGAIERSQGTAPVRAAPVAAPAAREPLRHTVLRGETAYSIARLYNVSVRALADWNGLGPDLAVREGQFLMIPVAGETRSPAPVAVSAPGQGSPTPTPPSAAKPLPDESTAPPPEPASPNLGTERTAASGTARLGFPAEGSIIRAYQKKTNEGIDIGAPAGAPVRAAADGTVAAITQDTDQVPILVIRHADNLLTVYANIDAIKVAKGDTVKRGQVIAAVRAGTPSFVHFEVRDGFESLDPVPLLQ